MKFNFLLFTLILLPLIKSQCNTKHKREADKKIYSVHKARIENTVTNVQTALNAVTNYKALSQNKFALKEGTSQLDQLARFGKYLNFGKILQAFGGIAAVASIVLAFIPVEDPVFNKVKLIDSKVDSLSSQLEDVKNALINKLDKTVYSAAYMPYELNIKNTWEHWIQSTSPYIAPGKLKDDQDTARILTLFTEKYEANQVMDSLRNLHRSVVTKEGSLGKNLLEILTKSSKCHVASLLEMKALYSMLFLQGSTVTLYYLLFKRFPQTYIEEQLKVLQDLYLDIDTQFAIKEMECYKRGEETAKEIIQEELNKSAKDSVPDIFNRLEQEINKKVPWIEWFLIVYDTNDHWGSVVDGGGDQGYYRGKGNFLKVSGGNKEVAAFFTPKNTSQSYSEDLNRSKFCSKIENIPPQRNEHDAIKLCHATQWGDRILKSDRLIGYHILRAYYANNNVAKEKWQYQRSEHDIRHTVSENYMIASDRSCKLAPTRRGSKCHMKVVAAYDLREDTSNPCATNPCGQHGECYVKWQYATEAKCRCHWGYTGETCQEDLTIKIDLGQLEETKVGAVDLVSVFYGLRDELHDVRQNLSMKLTDLELNIKAVQSNLSQQLEDARLQLNIEITKISTDVQAVSAEVEKGIRNIRQQFDSESRLLFNELFYADERKLIHLISDYYTEYLNNQLPKQRFIEKMKIQNSPNGLNFDLVRRRYKDWVEGRNSIRPNAGGIITDFKRKFWTSPNSDDSSIKFERYKSNIAMVKNYIINEFAWFVKAWREFEVVSFQKMVQDFQHWNTVNSIIEENGYNSELLINIPEFANVLKFQESYDLKTAQDLLFQLKWNFVDESCGELVLHDGIKELRLQSGDSYEDQTIPASCDILSGQIIVDSYESECKKVSGGKLQWSVNQLQCENVGSCCNIVQVSSATRDIQEFAGSYKMLEIRQNGRSVYQKEDDLGRLEDAFIFYGSTGWYMDREVSQGSAAIFNLGDSPCPANVKLHGGWTWSQGRSWVLDPSFQMRCM